LADTKIKKDGHCACLASQPNIKMKYNQPPARNAPPKHLAMRQVHPNAMPVKVDKHPNVVPQRALNVRRAITVPRVPNVRWVCTEKIIRLVRVLPCANHAQSDTIKTNKAVQSVFVAYPENTNHKEETRLAKIVAQVNI